MPKLFDLSSLTTAIVQILRTKFEASGVRTKSDVKMNSIYVASVYCRNLQGLRRMMLNIIDLSHPDTVTDSLFQSLPSDK